MTRASVSLVVPQVEKILERHPQARRFAFRASWPGGGDDVTIGGRPVAFVGCRSALELREALDRSESPARETGEALTDPLWVFLADLDPADLELDITARLARGRLAELDRWAAVRQLFGHPRDIDPRLHDQRWMADLLIAHAPAGGYAKVQGSVLDESTARRHLLARILELEIDSADGTGLLRWSIEPESLRRFRAAPETLQRALPAWLGETAGEEMAALWCAWMRGGSGADAVALGLVAGLIVEPADAELATRAKLLLAERFLDRHEPTAEAFKEWNETTEGLLADAEELRRVSERRALEILETLGATGLVDPNDAIGEKPLQRACAPEAFERSPGDAAPRSFAEELDQIFDSEIYTAQKRLLGRRKPSEAKVRSLLLALGEHGGQATLPALERELNDARLRGLARQVARLLNVEGYPVLEMDDVSDTLRLDQRLLRVQFGLDRAP